MKLRWINQWTSGLGDWQLISIGFALTPLDKYYDYTLARLHFIIAGFGVLLVVKEE